MSSAAVELVRVTPDAEKMILYVARVSSDQSNEDPGLLRYLIRNRHWSPFELAHMVIEIQTSRAIAQQILRHRSFAFQEFSLRYAEATRYTVYAGRSQAAHNRQSSTDDLDDATQSWWVMQQNCVARIAFEAYQSAIDRGIAKECARFLLPLSTETKLYMAGSVRSWIHYLELRCEEHTQLEHRDLAEGIRSIFVEQFPIVSSALGWAA